MSKYKLDKSAQVVENQNYTMTQEEVCERLNDLETKLAEAQKPKEIRFNGFVVDCNYDEARKVLQEDLLKMQAENNKLKESEELSNYAKCILENKKLEEDLELSEKCCVEYEQETQELKQQLAESEKKNEYFADRVEKYNKLVEKYNNLKEEVDSNFVDGQKYNELREQKDKEIQELKQQLAESEKKKEDFKTMYFNKCLDYEHLHEKFDDKCAEFELKEYDYKQTIFEKDQDKISFAVDILEELAGCSNYINSKLDFECGSYVSEKAIRDKIKYLKGKKDE